MKLKAPICTLLLLALLALSPQAWAAKVQVCHVPPGNPDNFHTITVSDNAVQAHLGHGDLLGSCNSHCDQLCDDGNACTIDACDGADHCALTHPPVNCDDSNLCTVDTCNPATGCSSTPKTCQDGNLCTVDTCDPLTGSCAFPPAACPAGQTCNPGNGSCESPTLTCPCNDVPGLFHDVVAGVRPVSLCFNSNLSRIIEGVTLTDSTRASIADAVYAVDAGEWTCDRVNQFSGFISISPEQGRFCANLLEQAAASQGVTCGPFTRDPCIPNPCQGEGTCEPSGSGFICHCPAFCADVTCEGC
jgi:Dictyostelium (slime mold) repeat